MKFGLRSPGLRLINSRQRPPFPRRSAASFHRESPGFTVTTTSVPDTGGATPARVGTGRTRGVGPGGPSSGGVVGTRGTRGAKGLSFPGRTGTTCEVGGTGVTGGASETAGAAGIKRGRSNGERLRCGGKGVGLATRGRAVVVATGERKGWAGGLGEASTGLSEKGR